MIPMLSYYLPLLPWSNKAIEKVTQLTRLFLWKKRGRNNSSWVALHYCMPKRFGGAALLNVFEHTIARKVSMLKFMIEGVQPWTKTH